MNSDILITDLYELTMLQAYFASGMEAEAVFEFFVRELPPGRGYLVAAGLGPVLDYLQDARFSDQDLAWLKSSGRFSGSFVEHLRDFRFRGDVHAMAEGSIFFPNEPILRVTAPIAQAQLVETRIINLLHYQILAATKAARCVTVAPDKLLVDFGLRRAHGAEAGLMAARCCYLAGFGGTSNVAAAARFNIVPYGTMAHSFIEAHDSELQAFADFARAQPGDVVLLIDTYDTEAAARKLPELASRLHRENISIKAVRIDSGDLADHAFKVRDILDAGGLQAVRIFASGHLDEYSLAQLLQAGAPIDGFGIGSKLNTSADAPFLDCAYKLVEYAGIPRRKQSEKKATLPGRKQIWRRYDSDGFMCGDVVALESEPEPRDAEPLLHCVMRDGHPAGPGATLTQARAYHRAQRQHVPAALRALDARDSYPVAVSPALKQLGEITDRYIRNQADAELRAVLARSTHDNHT